MHSRGSTSRGQCLQLPDSFLCASVQLLLAADREAHSQSVAAPVRGKPMVEAPALQVEASSESSHRSPRVHRVLLALPPGSRRQARWRRGSNPLQMTALLVTVAGRGRHLVRRRNRRPVINASDSVAQLRTGVSVNPRAARRCDPLWALFYLIGDGVAGRQVPSRNDALRPLCGGLVRPMRLRCSRTWRGVR
jgi:hypothetical protein